MSKVHILGSGAAPGVPSLACGFGNCDDEILIDEIIPILIEVSNSLGVEVINIYEVTDNHKEYFLDGLHPNYDGNIAISNKVYEAIKE